MDPHLPMHHMLANAQLEIYPGWKPEEAAEAVDEVDAEAEAEAEAIIGAKEANSTMEWILVTSHETSRMKSGENYHLK